MIVYLAGGIHGSGDYLWKEDGIYEEIIKKYNVALLESFYYINKMGGNKAEKRVRLLENFLLDSGAFTFFSSGEHVDWYDYIDRYADFIVRNNVKHFFELDIDVLVGYEKVLEFRKILEKKTGRKCIPVWHKSRGLDEFKKMCDEYDYIAIGGIVSKEITHKEYPMFTYLINEAHKRGCKIHGLGFTNLKGMRTYKFDSVDSTSWTTGNRFGAVYRFNGNTMKKYLKGSNQRIKDSKKACIHNFIEWVKFQKYAEKFL